MSANSKHKESMKTLRKNSTLLAALPWLTGAIKTYDEFSGSFVVPNGMEVSNFGGMN